MTVQVPVSHVSSRVRAIAAVVRASWRAVAVLSSTSPTGAGEGHDPTVRAPALDTVGVPFDAEAAGDGIKVGHLPVSERP